MRLILRRLYALPQSELYIHLNQLCLTTPHSSFPTYTHLNSVHIPVLHSNSKSLIPIRILCQLIQSHFIFFQPIQYRFTMSSSSSSSGSSSSDGELMLLFAAAEHNNQILQDELSREESSDGGEDEDVVPIVQMGIEFMNELTNPPKKKRGGSKMGRGYTYRNHVLAAKRLEDNYFAEGCTFDAAKFKLRFRIKRRIFDKIYEVLKDHPLFVQKLDAAGKPGIHPKVKMTVALRFLAYGSAADALDETYYIGNQTAFTAVEDFCTAMNEQYGAVYLRAPNNNDMKVILDDADERGWPGCIGSLDCTTWRWEMCPTAWVGQFIGKESKACVQMEAVCGHDGWIWNYVFGLAGGMNDLSVLEHSSIFKEYCTGKQPPVNFVVNGRPYNLGYYLCDDIYLKWGSLINAIKSPVTPEHKYFTTCQESTRKDIEQVFGKLKGKWHIIKRPARYHKVSSMGDVMNTCIILHNMIIHDRCKYHERDFVPDSVPREVLYPEDSMEYKQREAYCRNLALGHALKEDLVAHLWNRRHLA